MNQDICVSRYDYYNFENLSSHEIFTVVTLLIFFINISC